MRRPQQHTHIPRLLLLFTVHCTCHSHAWQEFWRNTLEDVKRWFSIRTIRCDVRLVARETFFVRDAKTEAIVQVRVQTVSTDLSLLCLKALASINLQHIMLVMMTC